MLTYITVHPYTAFLAGLIVGFVFFGACFLWESRCEPAFGRGQSACESCDSNNR